MINLKAYLLLIIIIILCCVLALMLYNANKNSSPVEDMQHNKSIIICDTKVIVNVDTNDNKIYYYIILSSE